MCECCSPFAFAKLLPYPKGLRFVTTNLLVDDLQSVKGRGDIAGIEIIGNNSTIGVLRIAAIVKMLGILWNLNNIISVIAFGFAVVAFATFAAFAFFVGMTGELAFLTDLHLALSLHFLLFASAAVRIESMSCRSKS